MEEINYDYGDKYYGETNDGRKHGFGRLTKKDGRVYTGYFQFDQYDIGILLLPDGRKFIGKFDWKNHMEMGIILVPNGDVHIGEFCESLGHDYEYQVKQIDISKDGNSYVGEYLSGEYHGSGTLSQDSEKYIGQFYEGKKHGDGIFYSSEGKDYIGEFKNNNFMGPGMLKFSNGKRYIGEFEDGKLTGSGMLVYSDGRKLIGEFDDSALEGAGIFVPQIGAKYIGEYKNGKRNGNGILDYQNGDKFIGEFLDGKKNGFGIYSFQSGDKYIGNYKNGTRNGKGKLLHSSGSKYEGEFVDGKKEGYGELNLISGEIYEGNFRADKYHGKGKLIKPNGEVLEGEFANGHFVSDKISEAITWFIHSNKNLKPFYLFIDTETTGLFDDSCFEKQYYDDVYLEDNIKLANLLNAPRLIRLSYIIHDKDKRTVDSKDFIIRPTDFTIPVATTKIHGITTEKAKREGWPLKKVLEHFRTVSAHVSKIVGHNTYFDYNVIANELLRHSIHHNLPEYFIDTMLLSADFCGIKGKYGNKYPKLTELHFKLFGKDFEGAHDSSVDVAITSKCFWELKRLGVIN